MNSLIFNYNVRHWVIVIILLFLNTLKAQVAVDTTLAYQYYQKGDSLLAAANYKKSNEQFAKGIDIYKENHTWERVADGYNKISKNYYEKDDIELSKKFASSALKICKKSLGKDTKQEADAYFNLGDYYKIKYDYDKALEYHTKAMNIRKKIFPALHEAISQSHVSLGVNHFRNQNISEALSHHEKALKIDLKIFGEKDKKIELHYRDIGIIYGSSGNLYKSIEYFKKGIEVLTHDIDSNQKQLGVLYSNIGISYFYQNQYENAYEYYVKALPLIKKHNDLRMQSVIYLNLGSVLLFLDQPHEAISYSKKSITLTSSYHNNEYHKYNIYNYINLGNTYRYLEKYEEAENYLIKALDIANKLYDKDHMDIAKVYQQLGDLFRNKKDYSKSIDFYHQALRITKNIFGENNSSVGNIYRKLGQLYQEKHNFETAISFYEQGLEIFKKYYPKQKNRIAQYYFHIANTHNDNGEYLKSNDYYDKAIKENLKSKFSKTDENVTEMIPEKYDDINGLIRTMLGKSNVLLLLYATEMKNTYIEESISLFRQIDKLINYQRQNLLHYQDKVTYAEFSEKLCKGGIVAQYLSYKNSQSTSDFENLFYYAEKSKAITLKELLTHSKVVNSGNNKKFADFERKIKTDRSHYNSQITKEQSKDSFDLSKIKEYENKLFTLQRQQDSLTENIKNQNPKYYHLQHTNNILSLEKTKQNLLPNQTLIEFFVADSTTYAFTISKNQYDVKELQTPKLEEQITSFRKATTDQDHQQYKKLGLDLYKLLIEPIKDQLVGDELIIVPDESLWHLNFDVLLTKPSDASEPSKFPYLLKDYAISYANSATLLFDPFEQKTTDAKQEGCLAFSFSDSTQTVENNNMSLVTLRAAGDDLPGTRKEIKAISEIVDGQYFFGNNADEANFKKHASNYKILHLALHGEVDNERPENSKLYFTKSKDTIEDNYLYSHELFALNIPAVLTVLSACNTGTGKIAKGEGIMSLGNAFQYAGTKSLLLSSWEVPDVTTPQLMQNFYTNLKDGMNKSKALQQAKLQYMEQADIYKAAPFYWGGFYLVGDPTPIDLGGSNWWIWTLVIGGLFLITLFFLKRKGKNA
ncbi:CHAT domain-containing protein [Aquimarina sp. SS2-1]|uniref:CHAT domain-containing protein n=1 Tax=Aquimarina besae TaxID=3342247 RepID=UPI00366E43F2